mgnify:CR=1 FL=1
MTSSWTRSRTKSKTIEKRRSWESCSSHMITETSSNFYLYTSLTGQVWSKTARAVIIQVCEHLWTEETTHIVIKRKTKVLLKLNPAESSSSMTIISQPSLYSPSFNTTTSNANWQRTHLKQCNWSRAKSRKNSPCTSSSSWISICTVRTAWRPLKKSERI